MLILPLVIDCHVPYVVRETGPVSLLTLPLGGSTLLDQLLAQIASEETSIGHAMIMPQFPVTPAYQEQISATTASPIQVVSPESLSLMLGTCEGGDYLLVVEPRQWPVTGYDAQAIMRQMREYRGAIHGVCVNVHAQATRELVQRDAHGDVKRVQRFYNLVNWPEVAHTAIVYSVVPAWAIGQITFRSLPELRTILSGRGMLSHDLPLVSPVVDLAQEHNFLSVHERVMADLVHEQRRTGFSAPSPEVLVGPGCQIDASVRIVAPAVIQEGVTIKEGVTLVGPVLVGSGSEIGRQATVIQSVLSSNTVVAESTTIRHRVACGDCRTSLASDEIFLDSIASDPGILNDNPYAEEPGKPPMHPLVWRRRIHGLAKRMTDVTVAALALMVLSPLMLLVALLIKLDSPGPALFIHRRERKGGRDFPCLKFRTMTMGAHRQQRRLYDHSLVDGPQFKMADDPRVTRLGRWLRATNIDELPQLINVLVGHMSLVGPRPSPFRENQICVPWRLARLSVRPGITGLWQICRQDDRSRGDFHEWIYYDIAYVRHFSIWLDLKIFLATVLTLGGRWSVPMSWLTRTSSRPDRDLQETLSG